MTDETLVATILRQRARALAQAPRLTTTSQENNEQLTEFVVQKQHFAIATQYVFATTAAVPVTPMPMQPAILLGIIKAFGQILPVINLAELLQLNNDNNDSNTTTNYLLLGQRHPELALAVSRVTGQLTFAGQVTETGPNPENSFVAGILPADSDKAPLSLLSGRQLLSDDRLFFSL